MSPLLAPVTAAPSVNQLVYHICLNSRAASALFGNRYQFISGNCRPELSDAASNLYNPERQLSYPDNSKTAPIMTELRDKMLAVPTRLRRSGDITDGPARVQIARIAFLLASLLIVLVSASLLFIGWFATREADRQAIVNQRLLLETALKGRFMIMARDQQSLARWDESVEKISLEFDGDFVADEFFDSLWFDFGLDRNLLIGPDDHILAEAQGDIVSYHTGRLDPANPFFHFVEFARAQYFKNRIRLKNGFGQRQLPYSEEINHPIHGFVPLGDTVALVHSMAIIPDDMRVALPEGNPVILISALSIDTRLVTELNDQLAFNDMQFARGQPVTEAMASYELHAPDGTPLGVFSWQGILPGQPVWQAIIPIIVLLGVALSFVAFGIAWKIGQLTVSLAKSEIQNRYLALHDPLSGLGNRLQYNRALATAVEQLADHPFSLLQCDLDKFKEVNDTLGHGAGDEVIKEIAGRLNDLVGSHGLVCRIGGDEFYIILNLIDRQALADLAGRIVGEISRPVEVEPDVFASVGVSLGIAVAPDHGTTGQALMMKADAAMYRAKETGRRKAVFADDRSGALDTPADRIGGSRQTTA